MADPTGPQSADLARQNPLPPDPATDLEAVLCQQGGTFSFLQVFRTLSRVVADQGGDPDQAIRIRPALSLELPRSPVLGVQRLPALADGEATAIDQGTRYNIQTGFLGLYGVSSPLPNFYTEDLVAAEQEDELQARLLLDVVHQRFYRLYAAALQKYQPVYELTEQPDSHFSKLLWGLAGARDPQVRQSAPQPALFLQYINLYSRQQRSAAGLHFILSDYLQGVPVEVEQCVEQQLDIPERDRLILGAGGFGQGKALGVNAVMGSQVPDYSGGIRIRIGPLPADDYQAFIGDRRRWDGLSSLIRAYVGPTLTCELDISLQLTQGGGTCLGDPVWGQLGLSSWLQSPLGTPDDPVLLVSRLRLN